MKLSFRLSLFLVMALVSLVPILALGFWSVHSAMEQEYQTVEEKNLLLANNISQALDRYAIDALAIFRRATESVNQNTLNPAIIKLLQDVDVMSLGKYSPQGERITVIFGPENSQPISLSSEQKNVNLSHETANNITTSHFTSVHKVDGESPSLYMIRQDAQGIWLATMHTHYISQLQSAVKFGEGGHAAIVDEAGNVLAHPNEQWQADAKNISEISIVQQMIAGQSGVTQFYSPAVDADMIAAYSTVPKTGWGVMLPQPMSELYSRIEQKVILIGILAIASLFIALLLSWWLSGLISRPIKILTRNSHQLAKAEPNYHPYPYSGIKVSEFIYAFEKFDQMADKIRLNQQDLEQKVVERTAEIAKAKADAIYIANHDSVTGLPNRMAIRQKLQQQMQTEQEFAVLFIDLDGFKAINDHHGHGVGDDILNQVALRSAAILNADDVIARYGGDEFVVMLPHSPNTLMANKVANAILTSIRRPYEIEGMVMSISACIGVAVAAKDEVSIDGLIHRADIAMYQAKNNGKDQVKIAS